MPLIKRMRLDQLCFPGMSGKPPRRGMDIVDLRQMHHRGVQQRS
jgi:hypothetical protein